MTEARRPRTIAFYLPQFHPIPENDEWWGPGFTEWRNVARATPMFRGHTQPHLPSDLGFYDLRVPEVRAAQAELARSHGIDAFCYYHYWFEGRRLLERPFAEVLGSGEPDFPFLLCWANESWTRTWNGKADVPLLRQTYAAADDVVHAHWLIEAFSDRRYLRVGGRPMFLVYRASQLADPRRTADTWRTEVTRAGIEEPYLCAVQSAASEHVDPSSLGFDAAVEFAPDYWLLDQMRSASVVRRAMHRFERGRPRVNNHIARYDDLVEGMLAKPDVDYIRYRCVTPGHDNSPRRPDGGATIITGSSPAKYGEWVAELLRRRRGPSGELLFVNAWNEWAESNHLEPCQRWGTGYLEAHAAALAATGFALDAAR